MLKNYVKWGLLFISLCVVPATMAGGKDQMNQPKKPTREELKKMLSTIEFDVTQNNGTEHAFENKYWDNHKDGIYVDVVTGDPLFSSKDKYDSGCGWPSFTKPIDAKDVVEKKDGTHGMERVEVRAAGTDNHLGHVFNDGPGPTRLRYCINSAALRFVPKEDLKKDKRYEKFVAMFETK